MIAPEINLEQINCKRHVGVDALGDPQASKKFLKINSKKSKEFIKKCPCFFKQNLNSL